MIIGAHALIYSSRPEADRAFLRDMLKLPAIDVGEGWLIFGLPPAELAIHPAEENDIHELYLMCDDVERFITDMEKENVRCKPVQNQGWGLLTEVTLPSGGKLGVYQPQHASPPQPRRKRRINSRHSAPARRSPRTRRRSPRR